MFPMMRTCTEAVLLLLFGSAVADSAMNEVFVNRRSLDSESDGADACCGAARDDDCQMNGL